MLPVAKAGTKDVVADHIEDLQFPGYEIAPKFLYVAHRNKSYIMVFDPATRQQAGSYITSGVDHYVTSMVFKETPKREQKSLIPIVLVMKTKKQYGPSRRYQTKDYFAGNHMLDKTDGHRREEFSTAVVVRNLSL